MEKSKRKHIATYKFDWKMRQLYLVLCPFVLVFGVLELSSLVCEQIAGEPRLLAITIMITALFFILAVGFGAYMWFWSEYRLYNDGLAYYMGGQKGMRNERNFTAWEDMTHFGREWDGLTYALGIFAQAPENSTQTEKFIPLTDYVEITKVRRKTPPVVDLEALRETEFGQYVYEYAPHLFDEETATRKANSRDV
ncbi:MAG: hypothetical protein AAFR81_13985 [Chloroflexota bacterium]